MSFATPDIKELPVICKDAGNSVWHYDSDSDCYYRLYKTGDFYRIHGNHLPDAEALWNNRIESIKKRGRTDIARVKPTDAVFALSNHHKKILAAGGE